MLTVVGSLVLAIATFLERSALRVGVLLMFLAGTMIAATHPVPQRSFGRSASTAAQDADFFERQRHRASKAIEEIFRDDAPMAKALLIAEQSEIPREVKQRYSTAGLIHMLSISGLHVSIIAGAVELILHMLRLPLRLVAALSLSIIVLYVAIIGFPPPALRAGVMVGVSLASRVMQRPTSRWGELAVGAFIPLISPPTILNLGYQLSVGGIAGLIASGAVMRRYIAPYVDGWRKTVIRSILSSSVTTLVTAPLVAWTFGQISLIGAISNLFADPVISLLQPMLFLALILAPIPPLARFVADAAHLLLILFDAIAKGCAAVPFAAVQVTPSRTTAILAGLASTAIVIACVSRFPARAAIFAATAIAAMTWVG
jgi:competence protein ComEC